MASAGIYLTGANGSTVNGNATIGTASSDSSSNDLSGTYTYNVDPAANFTTNASATPADDGNGPTMALAAILAALILAVGFSWPTLVTRLRR